MTRKIELTDLERRLLVNAGNTVAMKRCEWQPIETAPKDEWILAYADDFCHVAKYEMSDWDGFYDKPVMSWCTCQGFLEPDDDFAPTHWQSLPKPPTKETK